MHESENKVTQLCPTPRDPWTAAYQAPLSMEFSRQEYWSGLPLPSPRTLKSGMEYRATGLRTALGFLHAVLVEIA